MPGAGLLVIKRRIKSVRSTQKITKAMALVSTAKAKKAREMLFDNNEYFAKFETMKEDLFRDVVEFQDSKFLNPNKGDKKLYVVFASNSGFCGGFNGSGPAYLADKFETREERKNVKLFVIGHKGMSYASKYGFEVVGENDKIKDNIDIKVARELSREFMNLYSSGEYGEISFVYTKFNSPMNQELIDVPILPMKVKGDAQLQENLDIFELGENPDELVTSFVYRYIKALIINTIYNAKSSEENARMQAMEGATKNAGEIIDDLNRNYNRIRQAAITQEISEIVGGAEAQK